MIKKIESHYAPRSPATFDPVVQSFLTHRPQSLRQLDGFFHFSHSGPSADSVGAEQKASLLFL